MCPARAATCKSRYRQPLSARPGGAYTADPSAKDCMNEIAQPLLDFVKAHQDWAVAIMFLTAFGESFAFLSLLFPGTTLLIAAGTLMSDGTLPYAPVLIGAIAGATLGDSVSYWIGR